MSDLTQDSPISALHGVASARAKALARLNIHTVGDLVRHYPRAYQNRGDIRPVKEVAPDERHAFLLTIATEISTRRIKGNMSLSKMLAFDDSGSVEIVFFNQPYVEGVFHVGDTFRFFGQVTISAKRRQIVSPQYELYREDVPLPDFISVYPTTEGLSQKVISALVKQALDAALHTIQDPLPDFVRTRAGLPTLSYALKNIHFPETMEALDRSLRRVMFDELYTLGIAIALSKAEREIALTDACSPCSITPLTALLPYELTRAQKKVINEIYSDMTGRGHGKRCPAMRRILIGDVGCGKTICAAAAILIAVSSGYQAALMVPTSILAHQHYADMAPLFAEMGYEVALLTGATPKKEKNAVLKRLADPASPLPIVIGTHALLSDSVAFARLGLTVTDEQHRFGVMQRAALKEKYDGSHTLVMSATPIPRTLAHVLYGDLSVSRIDEMPVGRKRVDTFVVGESYRARLNGFIRKQVEEGGQVYIVCPSIEEKQEPEETDAISLEMLPFRRAKPDTAPLKNATQYAASLQSSLPDIPIALLHGRMKQAEKDEIMNAFVAGETKVLVSTTVIEVGVNVPSATLMIVENAERFGLSQLHQLRGRVGRGKKQAWCILVSDSRGEGARARLETMQSTYDGYEIAERDLALRGPGDFFSTLGGSARQSGGLSLSIASCCDDTALMSTAFELAGETVHADPELQLPENALLRKTVDELFRINQNTIS